MSAQTEIEVGQAVAERQETALAVPNVEGLMQMALQQGPDGVEALERLVGLQERLLDRQAEVAMAESLARFRDLCPPIPKSRRVDYTTRKGQRVRYSYASLDVIAEHIRPHLKVCGLSYTWSSDFSDDRLTVVCTLHHAMGATRFAEFGCPIAGMEQMNVAQQHGSTLTYGQRYSLIQVLGLTASDDLDGEEPSSDPVTDEQLADLLALAQEVDANLKRFTKWLGVESLAELPASRYDEARTALEAKRGDADEEATASA